MSDHHPRVVPAGRRRLGPLLGGLASACLHGALLAMLAAQPEATPKRLDPRLEVRLLLPLAQASPAAQSALRVDSIQHARPLAPSRRPAPAAAASSRAPNLPPAPPLPSLPAAATAVEAVPTPRLEPPAALPSDRPATPSTESAAPDAGAPVALTSELAVICAERSAPRYPRESRRRRETGLVVLRVEIDEAGVVSDVQVDRSSGHSRLDEAAITAVRGWRCRPPALDGRAMRGSALQPFDFRLGDTP